MVATSRLASVDAETLATVTPVMAIRMETPDSTVETDTIADTMDIMVVDHKLHTQATTITDIMDRYFQVLKVYSVFDLFDVWNKNNY